MVRHSENRSSILRRSTTTLLSHFVVPVSLLALSGSACSDDEKAATVPPNPEVTPELGALVEVPAGQFLMGDGASSCGTDERLVTLTRAFHLGATEVTNQQYATALQWALLQGLAVIEEGHAWDRMDGSNAKLVYVGNSGDISVSDRRVVVATGREDHPVTQVTWHGAVSYCDWLSLYEGIPRAYDHDDWTCNGGDPYSSIGYRLPTDAEWEHAARYGHDGAYPWGDESPTCDAVNFGNIIPCADGTVPVGSFAAAPAILGLFDMAGNVSEWCDDAHVCEVDAESAIDPTRSGGTESRRVVRGGSYPSPETNLRCANRFWSNSWTVADNLGFRVARTVSSPLNR